MAGLEGISDKEQSFTYPVRCFVRFVRLSIENNTYCNFGNFREGFIFAKLRICEVL